MVLDSLEQNGLESVIIKSLNRLDIIKYKCDIVKSNFNYRNLVVSFNVIISTSYGISIFVNFYQNTSKLAEDVIDIIDIYENFCNKAKQELSKKNRIKSVDLNVYAYFPNLVSDYFKADLFSDAINEEVSFLKESIDNIYGEIKFDTSLINLITKQDGSINNKCLIDDESLLDALSIFTNNTIPDMGTLILDDKIKDARVSSMLKRFELDDSQVHKIETQNSENRIILAEAGTGKSVILFSKAQRIAALNPGKKILMLAYNNYLVQETIRKREYENIKESEIDIYTMDKYVDDLFQEYVDDKENIDRFDKSGKIEKLTSVIENLPKYDAIFIDEIQQFKADWIQFLFKMLNSHEKGKYCFILCGDINQSSNKNDRVAAWRKANLPSFSGRRIKLEKKYRSTLSINQFTTELVKNIYTLYARNKMEILSELEGEETYDIDVRETNELIDLSADSFDDVEFFQTVKDIPKKEDDSHLEFKLRAEAVVDYLIKLQNKGYDLREFVIVYPFQKSYGRPYVEDIEAILKEKDITYSSTRHRDENDYITYDQIKSRLAITSVEKCIGLDFNYIVVIGLDTFGKSPVYPYPNVRFEAKIDELDHEQFRRQISQFYVALTRAKKKLFIEIPGNYLTSSSKDDMFRKLLLGDLL